MIYTENVYIALAIPLAVAVLLLRGDARRSFGFFLIGLSICLVASFINTFLASSLGMTGWEVVVRVTPVFEEILKAFPVFFYFVIFKPSHKDLFSVAVAVGLGFATMENVCQIISFGTSEFLFVLLRGLSAGVMHTICAALLGYGLSRLSRYRLVLLPGALGLLCAACVFHSIYNLFVTAWGVWQLIGYALPIVMAAVMLGFLRRDSEVEMGTDTKTQQF